MLPRFYSSGRKIDRMLAWALMVLHCFMAIFIVYTSYQQGEAEKAREESSIARDRAEQDRQQLNASIAEQNRLILCFAADAQAFNLAIADAILVAQPRPEQVEEFKHLAEIRDRLRAGEKLTRSKPPNCDY